ncbi:MAG: flagellar hook protein FlgE [Pseudomonadota bacterium]|jgi:flagellar hook protein FlgE
MSFQQGLSGLNATSRNLEVIGNNIANASTFGAKTSRAEFADMYAGALGNSGAGAVGMGVRVAAIAQQFSQGNITTTENPLDIAINGGGFFTMKDSASDAARSYTRNGQFKVNSDGYIVNNDGRFLLDSTGNVIQVPSTPNQPVPTTTMGVTLNLNMKADPVAPPTVPVNFSTASTYTSSTSMTIYDQGGGERALTYYFRKTADNSWDVYASVDGTSVATTTDAGGNTVPASIGTLTSSTNGATLSPTSLQIDTTGLNGMNLSSPLTLDLTGSTQYSSNFGVTKLTVDGNAMGQLSGLSVDPKGQLLATYSNGKSVSFAQIGLTTFDNPQGLQPIGGNAWRETLASGEAAMGNPTEGTRGLLQSGALEESNVDLTAELVNMMTAQRMYQANSQTIKTEDQILQTLVNLR